ncbi:MAG: CBS domain-containing protein, partial [Trichodesmium sp. St18_bin1]|nr:CBS domain-containing protein [Trichodesmium sp. St18_bin1]
MVARSSIYSSPLQQAIDPYPLTMTPDTPLVDVLQLISKLQNSCAVPDVSTLENEVHQSILLNKEKATYVLVVKNKSVKEIPEHNTQFSLLGIFTTSDIVRLIATGKINSLENLSKNICLGEVMTSNVVTLKESEDQDLFTALSLFRKYKIAHLPVL